MQVGIKGIDIHFYFHLHTYTARKMLNPVRFSVILFYRVKLNFHQTDDTKTMICDLKVLKFQGEVVIEKHMYNFQLKRHCLLVGSSL